MVDFSDLPTMLGQALGFTGGTADDVGGIVLSIAVLATVGLAFSSLIGNQQDNKSHLIMTSIIMFVTMGFLFEIGWMPFVFLAIAVVLVAVMFASAVKKGMSD